MDETNPPETSKEDQAITPPAPDTVISPQSPSEEGTPTPTENPDSNPDEYAASETTPPEKSDGGYPPVSKPKKSKKGLILLIILVLAVAGAAYYWFMVRKDTKTDNQTTTVTKKDVDLIRYGSGEGVLNVFAPEVDSDSTTILVNKQIFEPLVDFREKTKLTPVLATSWTNPDANTWIFTLKPNVKFHTGNTMTAKDVLYSYEKTKTNEVYGDQITSTIKSIEAVGDNQVKIVTKEVDPILLNRLSSLLIIDSTAAGKVDPKYGTGPYMVKDGTTPDETNIDLVAFDGYHGGHVYTKEVQVKVYKDDENKPGSAEETMGADIKAGKLDITGFISADRVAEAKKAGLQIFSVDDNSIYYVVPNVNKKTSPLSNIKVRQAIYAGIDVDALLKAIGRDGSIANQVVAQYIPGYNSAITRPKTDVAAAKQLLKDAGYPNGTSFTLTVYSGAQDAGQEIVRQLKDIGITVKLNSISDINQLEEGATNGTFEAYYFADGSIYNDANDVFSRNLQSKYYSNSKIDTLMDQAGTSLDQTKRLDDLKQISKLAMDDVALVPLYSNVPEWVAAKPYVMTQDLLSTDLGVLFYKVHLN